MTQAAAQVFRDYITDGVPASGAHPVVKSEVRAWGLPLDNLASMVNILDYGADPTGANDSAAALTAALAASNYVKFPPGHYKFLSAVSYTIPSGLKSVTIVGSGQEVTVLDWTAGGNGITINFNGYQSSAHVRDMTIATGGTASGIGLTFTLATLNSNAALSAGSDVTNVTFRGDDGLAQTKAWNLGLNVNNVSDVDVVGCYFVGTASQTGSGINFQGASGLSSPAVALNVVGCDFLSTSSGIVYGSWAQGVTVVSTNFTGGAIGINQVGSLPLAGTELTVTGSQFEQTQGIFIGTLISSVLIAGNLFIIGAADQGIVFAGTQDLSIIGNDFSGASVGTNTGVFISGTVSASGVVFSGNHFRVLQKAIDLASTAAGVIIGNNFFSSNSTNINNASVATNNKFTNNVGYNPVGVTAAATVGTSPATITAGPSPETHYLKQSATNTATVAKGGQQVAALVNSSTYYVVELGPNESMVVTWTTTAPTDTKDAH